MKFFVPTVILNQKRFRLVQKRITDKKVESKMISTGIVPTRTNLISTEHSKLYQRKLLVHTW